MKYIFHVRSFLPEFYTIIYPTTFSVDCSYLTGGYFIELQYII